MRQSQKIFLFLFVSHPGLTFFMLNGNVDTQFYQQFIRKNILQACAIFLPNKSKKVVQQCILRSGQGTLKIPEFVCNALMKVVSEGLLD